MKIRSEIFAAVSLLCIHCSISHSAQLHHNEEDRRTSCDTVSVTIIGDVMLHQSQIDNCRERFAAKYGKAAPESHDAFDFTPYFAEISDILEKSDISVANMEFTLSGPPFSGYPAFAAPDSYAYYMADCGINVFLTANNHILDKGARGMSRTLATYTDMDETDGVLNTGSFTSSESMSGNYPLIIECKGTRIALVNFTYGTNVSPDGNFPKTCTMDKEEISAALAKARENADIIIALPHWGTEYALRHSAEQEAMAYWLAENGADIIVGSHPHVVQDTGTITVKDGQEEKSVRVIYSTGNIISNMSAANTQIGLIVQLKIAEDSDGKAKITSDEYTYTWCSLPGRLTDSHITIPVKKYKDTRGSWKDPGGYDKMIDTYSRILKTSGIKDK